MRILLIGCAMIVKGLIAGELPPLQGEVKRMAQDGVRAHMAT